MKSLLKGSCIFVFYLHLRSYYVIFTPRYYYYMTDFSVSFHYPLPGWTSVPGLFLSCKVFFSSSSCLARDPGTLCGEGLRLKECIIDLGTGTVSPQSCCLCSLSSLAWLALLIGFCVTLLASSKQHLWQDILIFIDWSLWVDLEGEKGSLWAIDWFTVWYSVSCGMPVSEMALIAVTWEGLIEYCLMILNSFRISLITETHYVNLVRWWKKIYCTQVQASMFISVSVIVHVLQSTWNSNSKHLLVVFMWNSSQLCLDCFMSDRDSCCTVPLE